MACASAILLAACGGGKKHAVTTTTTTTVARTTIPVVTTTTAPPVTYRVVRGDTLGRIARKFGVPVSAIVAANKIAEPDKIAEGQVLVIPTGSSTATTQAGQGAPSTSAPTAPGSTSTIKR
jgi:peptidoglycan endopeptidase LytE